MKKMLGVLLAMAIAFPASADVLKNVNLKGEIQTIASDVRTNNNLVPAPYNTGVTTRVMAGLSADLVEDVTANFMFQYANFWGNDAASGNSAQNYWDSVRLVEGNVVLSNLFCCLEATIGRQFYGEEDSEVLYFGPNHYNAEFNGYAPALDALKLAYTDDVKAFTFIAGKANMTHLAGISDDGLINAQHGAIGPFPNTFDIFGADFKLKLAEEFYAKIYGYDFMDSQAILSEDKHLGFYGAKIGADMQAMRFAVQYNRNFGGKRLIKEHEGTGHMAKVDFAMDIETLTARAAYMYANENFFALGNYTPGLLIGHDMGGAVWNYSTEGLSMFNLGFDMKPFDKWTFSLDGYSFQDRRFHHGATWEGDLTAKYDHNEYVQLFAGVGYVKYTKTDVANVPVYSKDVLGADNVKGQLGMLIKF